MLSTIETGPTKRLVLALHDLAQDVVLVREVRVDRAAGEACLLADVLDGGAEDALLGEHHAGGVEDALAGRLTARGTVLLDHQRPGAPFDTSVYSIR